jgi:NADH-quinone oxidoreductase subunit L
MPLHVWLPDAMAGPDAGLGADPRRDDGHRRRVPARTPVPGGGTEPGGDGHIAIVGVITLFFGGLLALVQDDLKKILAYSTISQLGYMVAAIGVGGYTASIFHLFTHGFFKALLFLAAGSLIHAVHSNNISDMGGMRQGHAPHVLDLHRGLARAGRASR